MPNSVTLQTSFNQWRIITNELITEAGALSALPTVDKTSLVNSIIEIDDNITDIISDIGNLDDLDTGTQVSIILAINEVVASIGTLNGNDTTFASSLGVLANLTTNVKTSIVDSINDLNTTKADKKSQNFTNLDLNNGRFASDVGVTASTVDDGLFNSFNSSVFSTTEQFFDDNITNGGAGSALTANITSLMTELVANGRTDQRYGYEFFILDITAGAGIVGGATVNTVDYYPIMSTNRARLGRIGSQITWQGWVKVGTVGEIAILGDANTDVYIDNSEETAPYELAETDGWVFVKLVKTLTNEYENHLPSIRCIDGTVVHVALSGFFEGDANIPTHLSLI